MTAAVARAIAAEAEAGAAVVRWAPAGSSPCSTRGLAVTAAVMRYEK
jgi:hypothetical protein